MSGESEGDHRHYRIMIDLVEAFLVKVVPGAVIAYHLGVERFNGLFWRLPDPPNDDCLDRDIGGHSFD